MNIPHIKTEHDSKSMEIGLFPQTSIKVEKGELEEDDTVEEELEEGEILEPRMSMPQSLVGCSISPSPLIEVHTGMSRESHQI